MTDQELAAIEARAEAATKGPWRFYDERYPAGRAIVPPQGPAVVSDAWDISDRNAEFIAHAREDVPALVREVRRLRELLAAIADDRPTGWEARGCSDGNCVVFRPRGQHTNAGCRCHEDRERTRWVRNRLLMVREAASKALEGT